MSPQRTVLSFVSETLPAKREKIEAERFKTCDSAQQFHEVVEGPVCDKLER